MPYVRSAAQAQADFHNSKAHESEVSKYLPATTIDNTDTNDRLDWWVPGYYLDLKTKTQPLTLGWHLLDAVPESDLFVLDELGYRKALMHFPHSFLLLQDIPNSRSFLAPIWELACVERRRVQRDKRAKFVIDMTQFHPTSNSQVHELACSLLSETDWKRSGSVGLREIPQVKKLK